jgi:hypothetical protein
MKAVDRRGIERLQAGEMGRDRVVFSVPESRPSGQGDARSELLMAGSLANCTF